MNFSEQPQAVSSAIDELRDKQHFFDTSEAENVKKFQICTTGFQEIVLK